MMTMTKAEVQAKFVQIKMGKGMSSSAGLLLAVMKKDGRAHVNKFIRAYPGTESAAEQALGRLIKGLKKELNGYVDVVRTRKNSTEGAWVRFERIIEKTELPLPRAKVPEFTILGGRYQDRGVQDRSSPIVLMTFNSRESRAVLECFCPNAKPMKPIGGSIQAYSLMYARGVEVVLTVSGQGPNRSDRYARRVFDELNPQAIIAVGCAFGVDSSQQGLGDVLVANSVYDYGSHRLNADGSLEGRPDSSVPPWENLLDWVRNIDQVSRHLSDGIPKIWTGPMLSGSVLVDNQEFRDAIVSLTGRIVVTPSEESEIAAQVPAGRAIGGDMEALGLARASEELFAEGRVMRWGVVKGISDWADGKKKKAGVSRAEGKKAGGADFPTPPNDDKRQEDAAWNAASVVYLALTGNMPKERKAKRTGRARLTREQGASQGIPEFFKTRGLDLAPNQLDLEVTDFVLESGAPAGSGLAEEVKRTLTADLERWANSILESEPSCYVLLGESGMGKTVSCQAFAVKMCEEYKGGKGRGALYFDLRDVHKTDKLWELNDLMTACANKGWIRELGKTFTAEQIWEWIDAGAVVIFDGLDEVMNSMNDRSNGPRFTRELLSVISQIDHRRQTVPGPAPRVLISSRTEFYPTLRDERARFVDAIGARAEAVKELKARILLPLNDDQVKEYLRKTLSDQKDIEPILETIRSTYDLESLLARPMTLSMVVEQVPFLEAKKAKREPVFVSTLYRELANKWAIRDEEKTTVEREDRLWLAQQLAAELTRRQSWGNADQEAGVGDNKGRVPRRSAEEWMLSLYRSNPRLTRYVQTDYGVLLQDFRNATFLRRHNEGSDEAFLEFAHTSLREFFLSEYLVDGLERKDLSTWSMPLPSTETLGFVAQTLAEPGHKRHVENLRHGVSQAKDPTVSHDPQVASMFLAYAVALRRQEGWKAKDLAAVDVDLRGIDLTRADLGSRPIVGIDLTGANLTQAKLGRGHFVDCVLDDANLTSLRTGGGLVMDSGSARRSVWSDVEFGELGFRGADLEGARWDKEIGQTWFVQYEPDDLRLRPAENSLGHPFNTAIPSNELKNYVRGSMRNADDIDNAVAAIREGKVIPWKECRDPEQGTIALGGYVWRVLEKGSRNGMKPEALLLAEHIVDMRPFHERFMEITWEDSSIREWLNHDFLKRLSFSDRIIVSDNDNYDLRSPRTAMRNTDDKVFFLAFDEAKLYLPDDEDRIATRWDGMRQWWWLRSSGEGRRRAAVVNDVGGVYGYWGRSVDSGRVGVRPALRINLES